MHYSSYYTISLLVIIILIANTVSYNTHCSTLQQLRLCHALATQQSLLSMWSKKPRIEAVYSSDEVSQFEKVEEYHEEHGEVPEEVDAGRLDVENEEIQEGQEEEGTDGDQSRHGDQRIM